MAPTPPLKDTAADRNSLYNPDTPERQHNTHQRTRAALAAQNTRADDAPHPTDTQSDAHAEDRNRVTLGTTALSAAAQSSPREPRANADAERLARPRSDEDFRKRTSLLHPDGGLELGRAAATTPPSREIPAQPPPPRLDDSAREPIATVPWYEKLSEQQQKLLDEEGVRFALRLCEEDRRAFLSGRRLTSERRRELLDTLSKQEKAERGLRFADEPSPSPSTAQQPHRPGAAPPSIRSAPAPSPSVLVVLMDLWFFADPLLLDQCADAWSHGVNIGYNGPHVHRTAQNLTRKKAELELLGNILETEIAEGRSEGWWAKDDPPFTVLRQAPAGFVDKKHTTEKRPIEHYSKFGEESVNAQSDFVQTTAPPLQHAVEMFHNAGAACHLVKWDIDKAYQVHRVRQGDRWLVVVFVPGKGWAVRTHCPFGLAASGFRWEVLGGKIDMTLYQVMAARIMIDTEQHSVTLREQPFFPRTQSEPDPLWSPPSGGFARLDAPDDTVFHPLGRQRLQECLANAAPPPNGLIVPQMDTIVRFVDDYLSFLTTLRGAVAVAVAVIFIHARLQERLKKKKFSHVVRLTDFRGYDWQVPRTISYPADKRARIMDLLKKLDSDHVAFDDLDSTIGNGIFLMGIYPQLRGLLSPLYSLLLSVPADQRDRARKSKFRKLIPMRAQAKATVKMLIELVKQAPQSVSSFLRRELTLVSTPHAVFHTDWAGVINKKKNDRRQGWGIFAITANEFVSTHVPAPFATWCKRDLLANSSPALEAFAWVLLMLIYGPSLQHAVVVVFADNLPAIRAFYKCHDHSVSSSPPLASALRQLALMLTKYSIRLIVEYIPSDDNLADSLSHHDLQDFEDRLGSRSWSPLPSRREALSLETPTW